MHRATKLGTIRWCRISLGKCIYYSLCHKMFKAKQPKLSFSSRFNYSIDYLLSLTVSFIGQRITSIYIYVFLCGGHESMLHWARLKTRSQFSNVENSHRHKHRDQNQYERSSTEMNISEMRASYMQWYLCLQNVLLKLRAFHIA